MHLPVLWDVPDPQHLVPRHPLQSPPPRPRRQCGCHRAWVLQPYRTCEGCLEGMGRGQRGASQAPLLASWYLRLAWALSRTRLRYCAFSFSISCCVVCGGDPLSGGDRAGPPSPRRAPRTHPSVLLAELLPLLAESLTEMLLVADQQAQLGHRPRQQLLRVPAQDLAQRLGLARQHPPGLRGQGVRDGHPPAPHRELQQRIPTSPIWLPWSPARSWPGPSCFSSWENMWCSIPAYSRSLLARCNIHFFISSSSRSSPSCSRSSALCPCGHHSSGPKPMAPPSRAGGCGAAAEPELELLPRQSEPFASHTLPPRRPITGTWCPGGWRRGAEAALPCTICLAKHIQSRREG